MKEIRWCGHKIVNKFNRKYVGKFEDVRKYLSVDLHKTEAMLGTKNNSLKRRREVVQLDCCSI
jgi:hypothetical protein